MIKEGAVILTGSVAHLYFAQPHWNRYFELSNQAGGNETLVKEFGSGVPAFDTIFSYAKQHALNEQAGRDAAQEWWSAIGYDAAIIPLTLLALLLVGASRKNSPAH